MALTKCLECGGQVSTHADACPHCGFPIKKQKELETHAASAWAPPQYEKCPVCLSAFDNVTGKCDVCGFTNESLRPKPESTHPTTNLPKCPTCGSTDIDKITAFDRGVAAGVFGMISKTARSQFRCLKCGYMW